MRPRGRTSSQRPTPPIFHRREDHARWLQVLHSNRGSTQLHRRRVQREPHGGGGLCVTLGALCAKRVVRLLRASAELPLRVLQTYTMTMRLRFFTPPCPETPRKRTSTGHRLGGGFAGFQHFRGHVRASGNHELLLNGWRRGEVIHDCQGATSYKLYTSKE